MRALIERESITGEPVQYRTREVDLGQLAGEGGHWRCPTCGGLTFTVQEKFGRLVLSCFKEPTHIALLP